MLTRKALTVNREAQKKTEAQEGGSGDDVPVDEERPWPCQERGKTWLLKQPSTKSALMARWERFGSLSAPRSARFFATELYCVTRLMTHLQRSTLSCSLAVASSDVLEATGRRVPEGGASQGSARGDQSSKGAAV